MTGIGRDGKSHVGAAGPDSTWESSGSSPESSPVLGEARQSFDSLVERMRSGSQDGMAPVVSRPPSSDVAAPTPDEIKAAKRKLRSLLEDLNTCRSAATHARNFSEAQELIDQVVKAGSAVLAYYANRPPELARHILPDDRARRLRDETLEAAEECNVVAFRIIDGLEETRKEAAALPGRIRGTATPDQLRRVVASVANHYVACTEWWGKKALRSERTQFVCAATANLPSTKPEMRKAEEATLRLHTGWALYTKCMYLQSQVAHAQLLIEPLADTFEPAVRDALMDGNGRARLLGTFIEDIFPAFVSTSEAVLKSKGAALDAEHRAVLEGVMERLSEFASGVSGMVAGLRDAGSGADVPLELLDQIIEGAWVTANDVMRLLAVQPKIAATIEPPAWAALHAAPVGEGTAARRKGKGRRAAAAGEGSSTAGRPEPQLAGAEAGRGPAKVIVLSDLGTKKLATAEEAHARASSSATEHLQMWQAPSSRRALAGSLERLDKLLQFDLPAQQRAVSQARQMKPEDAEHVLNIVVERLQTQAAEIKACVAALEEPRRGGLLTAAQVPEVHDKIVRLETMLSEVQGQANAVKARKAGMLADCMKTYGFPSQKYLEELRADGELEVPDAPRALSSDPGTLFEIKLQPRALRSGATPNPMWVHIHTKRPVHAWQLAMLGDADFAACHVKSNEQRGYNRHWQSARAAAGHENVVIHRGKLTPAFCRSLLSTAGGNARYPLLEAEHASMHFSRLGM
ncbi:hypothetical protein [Bradyrhizobium sp. STM 3562]|uniref:hypothetical protein n=1 Tax=Bradyrhizobium sp. STM 3562 TaxID=578924 RepID=UPI00389109C2